MLVRRMPKSNIGVSRSRGLLLYNSLPAVNAAITLLYSSCCVSLIVSNSVSCNSFALSSPLMHCSGGT